MKKTPAIVITYNPSQDLGRHLDILYEQFDQIILVDNGSVPDVRQEIAAQVQRRGSKLITILNSHNLGIATALNQGFSLSIQMKYDHVIVLDQDSIPLPGMREALTQAWEQHPNREKLAVVGSAIMEEILNQPAKYIRSGRNFFFERVLCNGGILRNITFVITSGSLYSLDHYQRIGPFREDFFIDAVDTEYCLRAVSRGYEISVACNAHLLHKLGHRQKKMLAGFEYYPTLHAPLRWYYISRNRIVLLQKYSWRFPHWFFYEIGVGIKSFAKLLFLEDQRLLKLRAVVVGTRDGLLGRMGKMGEKSEPLR